MACQWERYRDTRAPMPSQQQQVQLCGCTPCRNARLLSLAHFRAGGRGLALRKPTAERLAVLQWKPEPPSEAESEPAP